MQIIKCDVCKKTLTTDKISVSIRTPDVYFASFEFCKNCGGVLEKFLKKKKLLKTKEGSQKKIRKIT